ncbi:MAG: hypothetical protein LBF62_00340 [Tannerellaceae bacterium]|jgi:hypothetical protein|nr:hypothetical protein [Tannerellaceae bacterium]
MKKVSLLLLLCSIILAGCHKDDEAMPQWLVDRIDVLKSIFITPTTPVKKIVVSRREWKGRTVYKLYYMFSLALETIHYENGERVELPDDETERNNLYNKDWKVIYEFDGYPVEVEE